MEAEINPPVVLVLRGSSAERTVPVILRVDHRTQDGQVVRRAGSELRNVTVARSLVVVGHHVVFIVRADLRRLVGLCKAMKKELLVRVEIDKPWLGRRPCTHED